MHPSAGAGCARVAGRRSNPPHSSTTPPSPCIAIPASRPRVARCIVCTLLVAGRCAAARTSGTEGPDGRRSERTTRKARSGRMARAPIGGRGRRAHSNDRMAARWALVHSFVGRLWCSACCCCWRSPTPSGTSRAATGDSTRVPPGRGRMAAGMPRRVKPRRQTRDAARSAAERGWRQLHAHLDGGRPDAAKSTGRDRLPRSRGRQRQPHSRIRPPSMPRSPM